MTKPTPKAVAALERELAAARAAQTATAEILAAMNTSPGDPQPVFEAVAHHARLLAGAVGAVATRLDGNTLHLVAHSAARGYKQRGKAAFARFPRPLDQSALTARAILARKPAQIADVTQAKGYDRELMKTVLEAGGRSLLAVPLLHGQEALGSLMLIRDEPGRFDRELVAVLQGFAGHAAQALVNARLIRQTQAALDRETATAEILKVINASTADTGPVFEAIAERAMHLIGANVANVMLVADGQLHLHALKGVSRKIVTLMQKEFPRALDGRTLATRCVAEAQPVQVADYLTHKGFSRGIKAIARAGGPRSALCVPLMADGRAIGCIFVGRGHAGVFASHEVELLQTFAAQAVIALENARLFNETREALERQTATAGVLRVISGSVADSAPVFDTIIDSCRVLFGAEEIGIVLADDDGTVGFTAGRGDIYGDPDLRSLRMPYSGSMTEAVIAAGRARQFVDHGDAVERAQIHRYLYKRYGSYSSVVAPLARNGHAIGSLAVARFPAKPFSDDEVALVETFADQAVIAIENARLFNETREALKRQTATAEVLAVISSSIEDSIPVFDKILESCKSLFDSEDAGVVLVGDDGLARIVARGELGAYVSEPTPSEGSKTLAKIRAREIWHIQDAAAQVAELTPMQREGLEKGGNFSLVLVPLVRRDQGIGAIWVTRFPARPFAEAEIALLQTFCEQAVIALENARLFNETREALERQRATGEVLAAIGASVSDTQPVFEKVLDGLEALVPGAVPVVLLIDEHDQIDLAAWRKMPEAIARAPFPCPVSETPTALAIQERRVLHYPDVEADAPPPMKSRLASIGNHSIALAPMIFEGRGIGSVGLVHLPPRPFSDKELALLKTFSDQAAIAVENARLFNDTRAALERQTATAEVLRVVSQSIDDKHPVLEAIVAACARSLGASEVGIALIAPDQTVAFQAAHGAVLSAQIGHAQPYAGSFTERVVNGGRALHVPSVGDELATVSDVARAVYAEIGNYSVVNAPLTWQGTGLGAISVVRVPPRPFSDPEIALLESFADQAVIAINNAKLFKDTHDTLERQTATAEVLQVISQSIDDQTPVFDKIVDSCRRVLAVELAAIGLIDEDGLLRLRAVTGNYAVDEPAPNKDSMALAKIRAREIWHVPSVADEPNPSSGQSAALERYGNFTNLLVPLVHRGEGIGGIWLSRVPVRAFSDEEIGLITTFADQATIAIQNAKLFKDTHDALERQTATGEVLQVISQSVDDNNPVFEKIVDSCHRLLAVDYAGLAVIGEDGLLRLRAVTKEFVVDEPAPSAESVTLAKIRACETWHVPSVADEPDLTPGLRRGLEQFGNFTNLLVPLVRRGEGIGGILLSRFPARAFTDDEIALITTFADQAVIAIQNAKLFQDTRDALERQTATAEVLAVISGSPTDSSPVFEAIAVRARRLCAANYCVVTRYDGERVHLAGLDGFDDAQMTRVRDLFPTPLDRGTVSTRAILARAPVQIRDIAEDAELSRTALDTFAAAGSRSGIAVPMLAGDEVIGAIFVSRGEVGDYPDELVRLLETFAAQAVIAIENARLFNETQEALERQTATAEVLEVISGSLTDVQPVFDVIAERAAILTQARVSWVVRVQEGQLALAAVSGLSDDDSVRAREVFPAPLDRSTVGGRAVLACKATQVADLLEDDEIGENYKSFARTGGPRSALAVPLLRDGQAIGALLVSRGEPAVFSGEHVALLETFAAQAVIAIENTRLFNETQEALERQTATAEVLEVISASPTDVQPVFEVIAERTRVLSGADVGAVMRLMDGEIHLAAIAGMDDEVAKAARAIYPLPLDRASCSGRAILERHTVEIVDFLADEDILAVAKAVVRKGSPRSALAVPLLLGDQAIGVIFAGRNEVGRFDDETKSLLGTFAAQAVIAIENTRLFKETQDGFEQQTAIADILRVTTEATRDIAPILDVVARHAARLCDAASASIFLIEGDHLQHIASRGPQAEQAADVRPVPLDRESTSGVAVLERRVVEVADMQAETATFPRGAAIARRLGHHSLVCAPLMREGEAFGTIILRRMDVRPFDAREVALLRTFADQAAIAIHSVRLFRATEEALEQQTATADVLRVISGSMDDAVPVFERILDCTERLVPSEQIGIFLVRDDHVHAAAQRGRYSAAIGALHPYPVIESPLEAMFKDREPLHVPDVDALAEAAPIIRRVREAIGNFSGVTAPLVLNGRPIGALTVFHVPPRPFSDKEIALLRTFADQAVVAIENARLFRETNEALERQTATAEVLQVISGSVESTAPVFDAILDSCERLVVSEVLGIALVRDDSLDLAAVRASSPHNVSDLYPCPLARSGISLSHPAALAAHIVDTRTAETLSPLEESWRARIGDFSGAVAPMLLNGRVVGSIFAARTPPRAYTEKERALLQTFANQAVIAIENARLFRETNEALEQQTATAEVLSVISSSMADTAPVFERILDSCERVYSADQIGIVLEHGEQAELVAMRGVDHELLRELFPQPIANTMIPVVARTKQAVHIAQASLTPGLPRVFAEAYARHGDFSMVVAPMLHEGRVVGTIGARRQPPRPFSEKDIALLRTFADQAVIAIENARLFREINEALERQTATAGVLNVISRSVEDTGPVFDSILEACVRLFGGEQIALTRFTAEGMVDLAAFKGPRPDQVGEIFPRPLGDSLMRVAAQSRAVVHYPSVKAIDDPPGDVTAVCAALDGDLSLALAPMLWESACIGTINVARMPPKPFNDKELRLLQTFADQATIAIQNSRLFHETREALERQTATSDVLSVISSSMDDTAPVFERILDSCERLYAAENISIGLVRGDELHMVANRGPLAEYQRSLFPQPVSNTVLPRMAATGTPIHVPRVSESRDLPDFFTEACTRYGDYSMLVVPMLFEGRAVGSIATTRQPPRAFSDKEIALLRTFADQAVVAIENARLFRETNEALERQTATAEVLATISSSVDDTAPVFEHILDSCERLVRADQLSVLLFEDGLIHLAHTRGPLFERAHELYPYPIADSPWGAGYSGDRVVYVPDSATMTPAPAILEKARALFGDASFVSALMMRGNQVIGVINAMRQPPRPFAEKEIALLRTFADQAVVAIENARLFRETNEALEQQTATADVLKVIGSSVEDAAPAFHRIIDSCSRLFGSEDIVIALERDNGMVEVAAFRSELLTEADAGLYPMPVERSVCGMARDLRRPLHFPHVAGRLDLPEDVGHIRDRHGDHSLLVAPMMKDGRGIGWIIVSRFPARPFSDKDASLLGTFADQAVIAIENARMFRETNEALERQTATAEVLSVISSSVADVAPVFEQIVASCCKLLVHPQVALVLVDDNDVVKLAAYQGEQVDVAESIYPMPLGQTIVRNVAASKKVEYYPSMAALENIPEDVLKIIPVVGDYSEVLAPILRGDRCIGALAAVAAPPQPFSAQQIALLKTFADQAGIAIENARLFRETNEALERQTATAEVLKVIGSSVEDSAPVFDKIVDSCRRLFDTDEVVVYLECDGQTVVQAVGGRVGDMVRTIRDKYPRPTAETVNGMAIRAGTTLHFPDAQLVENPAVEMAEYAQIYGSHTVAIAPMMWEGRGIGSVVVGRFPQRPFNDQELALLTTFADQAVIAVQNSRLFRETNEALEQQTATAEVLSVISRSIEDTEPVFDKILDSCSSLFLTEEIALFRLEGSVADLVSYRGTLDDVAGAALRAMYPRSIAGSPLATAAESGEALHLPSLARIENPGDDIRLLLEVAGDVSLIVAPMMRDNRCLGFLNVGRVPPQPFTAKEMALLKTFADQAVIAIENARLFRETNEALERQTATAEVLAAISQSIEDTAPVFERILDSCERLVATEVLGVVLLEGGMANLAALRTTLAVDISGIYPYPATETPIFLEPPGRLAAYFDDSRNLGPLPEALEKWHAQIGDFSGATAPMVLNGRLIGAIAAGRVPPRPFNDNELQLLQTFANQAVVAIENARLFRETHEALERQTATAEVLSVISQSVEDTSPVFDKIIDSCFNLFDTTNVGVFLVDDNGDIALAQIRGVATDEIRARFPRPLDQSVNGLAIREKRVLHFPSVAAAASRPADVEEIYAQAGDHSLMVAPMLWEGRAIGTVLVGRVPARAFADDEIALLRTFADQAVIALQNSRLFRETNEALERQTALSEVLQVIGSSVEDPAPVFDKVLDSCHALIDCEELGLFVVREDGLVDLGAPWRGYAREGTREFLAASFPRPAKGTLVEIATRERRTLHYPHVSVANDPSGLLGDVARHFGDFSIVIAPMLWKNRGVGTITAVRTPPRPFAQADIDLITTFAGQAVIAIENARLFRETNEALQRQTATADVLKVIGQSVADTHPVFEKIIESGRRLFETDQVSIFLVRDDAIEIAAIEGDLAGEVAALYPRPLDDSLQGLAVRSGQTVNFASVEDLDHRPGDVQRVYESAGNHSVMVAPMLWEGRAIGAILAGRAPPRPFMDDEVALLSTFADQAVIAIQNARLFNETREALEQKSATAEVLRVISDSVEDTGPVFEKIIESCSEIFHSPNVAVFLLNDAGQVEQAASMSPASRMDPGVFPRPATDSVHGLVASSRQTLMIPSVAAVEARPGDMQRYYEAAGDHSLMIAPMTWEGRVIGTIVVAALPPRPFSDSETSLLTTFAGQAVIAIQNSRLFRETNEALQRQIATADVLRVIGQSVENTAPVFEEIVDSCQRLFSTASGQVAIFQVSGNEIELAAIHKIFDSDSEAMYPRPLDDSINGLVVRSRQAVQFASVAAVENKPGDMRQAYELVGDHSLMVAPVLWEGRAVGTLLVSCVPPRRFAEDEVALLRTFADQAAIAIQNARLFRETHEALQRQTATAEVLSVISQSVEDTTPVYEKIIDSCRQLFDTGQVSIFLVNGEAIEMVAVRGIVDDNVAALFPRPLDDSVNGLSVRARHVVNFSSVTAMENRPGDMQQVYEMVGDHSVVVAPMLWEGQAIGTILVSRVPPRTFADDEVALLTTFADQAVIAIQNSRLFHEIEDKSRQLAAANQHKSEFLANMSHELRTPLNAVIGFSEVLLERMFGDLNDKQADYLQDIHASGKHLLSLINDILDLSKIEAGRMELEAEDFDLRSALENTLTLIRERAERHGITLALETAEDLDGFRADQRKFKQVMLNLLSNAVKFTPDGGRITVRARLAAPDLLEVAVADTGIGIAPEYLETIFEEFRQAGGSYTNKQEGTGLGLSLTRRIVELHGGTIGVESQPGAGATFTFTLPRQP